MQTLDTTPAPQIPPNHEIQLSTPGTAAPPEEPPSPDAVAPRDEPAPLPASPPAPPTSQLLIRAVPQPTGPESPPITAPFLKRPEPIAMDSVFGVADLRTPEEEVDFQECEAMIRDGCGHIARMGEALLRIRDKQLYKNEHPSFEVYCRERWGFGHTQAWRLVGMAEVFRTLTSIPGLPAPECEAQMRPLIGLPGELAQQAWLHALSWSRQGYVPSRLVKRAVKQVLRTEQPETTARSNADKMQRSRLRQSIRSGFQEVYTLLLGNAHRDVVIAKVQELQTLLERLLGPAKKWR